MLRIGQGVVANNLQHLIREKFRAHGAGVSKRRRVTFPNSGQMVLTVTWLPDKGVWAAFPVITDYPDRLFCWFGSSWTEDRAKALNITVEINLPVVPSNRRVAGRAILDEQRPELMFLGHRGGLGGGRRNVSIQSFGEAINGFERRDVIDIDGRIQRLFVIGPVQEPGFLDGLANYISECARLRETARRPEGVVAPEVADEAVDNPENVEDARKFVMQTICARRGQVQFRKSLLEVYKDRCAMSGCAVTDVLEAAHIMPYLGDHTNHVTNGLLLRTDIHTLFDLYLGPKPNKPLDESMNH